MKQIIIKSIEEECGEEYFVASIPDTEKDYKRRLQEAAIIALDDDYEFYKVQFAIEELFYECWSDGNGQCAFNNYLKHFGWDVQGLEYDFEYEW